MRGNGDTIFLNSNQDLFTNVALYITAIINNSIVIVEAMINATHPRH